jgi:hypothetical protein
MGCRKSSEHKTKIKNVKTTPAFPLLVHASDLSNYAVQQGTRAWLFEKKKLSHDLLNASCGPRSL